MKAFVPYLCALLLAAGCAKAPDPPSAVLPPAETCQPLRIEARRHGDGWALFLNDAAAPAELDELRRAFDAHAEIVDPAAGFEGRDSSYGHSRNPVYFQAPWDAPIEAWAHVPEFCAAHLVTRLKVVLTRPEGKHWSGWVEVARDESFSLPFVLVMIKVVSSAEGVQFNVGYHGESPREVAVIDLGPVSAWTDSSREASRKALAAALTELHERRPFWHASVSWDEDMAPPTWGAMFAGFDGVELFTTSASAEIDVWWGNWQFPEPPPPKEVQFPPPLDE